MAPKRRAGRRQADGSAVAGANHAVASALRAGRKRRPASARRASRANPMALLVAGAAIAVVALVAIAVFQVSRGAGEASSFEFSVYQGQDVLGGSNVNFADLLDDGKPVVLNFWAGNCPPCRAEMPALQRVYEKHQSEVIFLGLDVGVFTGLGTRQSALALLNELNITYPAGAPPNRTALVNYSVVSMPTTVFFGADGKVFRRWDGAISESQLENIVNAMLDAS